MDSKTALHFKEIPTSELDEKKLLQNIAEKRPSNAEHTHTYTQHNNIQSNIVFHLILAYIRLKLIHYEINHKWR